MLPITAFFLLWGVWAVDAEIHSLSYIYTAFTRPVGLPGIHKFSAMGLLDDRQIDYYDSTLQKKEPRETWMEDRLDKDYWSKGTSSRKTKEQWFEVNLDILTQRLGKNKTENHVLQWRHGCEFSDSAPNRQIRGIDMYSYDGDDFLSFDSNHKSWVASMSQAEQTKHKWNHIQELNDYTDGYLHKECVQWLDTFLKYRKEDIKNSPPDVYLYARPDGDHLKLICMASGFYPKEITLDIKRDGKLLDHTDGLQSTKVRPNEDRTHQIKKWIKIDKTDMVPYTCEVNHPATIHINKTWDRQVQPDPNHGGGLGLMLGIGLGVLVLLGMIITGLTVSIRLICKRRTN
ncbi:hypothetical protein NHX12_023311 [Muraenolepis orangiensis]|uniref:Ig-like domain-containing protein n=1 Tax=Muraenolepis orangiensis TaxID=630683 RepID=A0A9Q0EKV2_9TELE|nr:hypothetical protein NHX12_023311 [Muraenolepis orangiensis]